MRYNTDPMFPLIQGLTNYILWAMPSLCPVLCDLCVLRIVFIYELVQYGEYVKETPTHKLLTV